MTALLRRMLGFALVPALSVLSPLVILPLVASRFGAPGWSAVAIGTSTGGALSIVVGLSWPTVGAHLVASAPDDAARRRLYEDSLVSRLAALAVIGPAAALVAGLLCRSYALEGAVTALAVSLNGLTCAWYFVGTGQPRPLVVNEAGVRFAGSALIAAALAAGAGLWVYGGLLLTGGVASAVLNHRSIAGRRLPARPDLADLRSMVALHGYGTAARMVYGIYSTGSVSLVALVAPSAVASYAVFDRVLQTGLNGLFALPQGIAGWVSTGGPETVRRRALRVTALGAGLAVVLVPVTALGLPIAIHLLYAGKAGWTSTELLLAGVEFAAASFNRALVLVLLVPLHREWVVYAAYLAAAAIGAPLVLLLARWHGTPGALAAIATVDLILAAMMLVAGLRSRPDPSDGSDHAGRADGSTTDDRAVLERLGPASTPS